MRAFLAALAGAIVLVAIAAPGAGTAPSPSKWCGGTEELAADRPDAHSNAHQVHVIYAYPADRPSRFPSLSLGIARDVAALDTWWRAQDSSRTIRFDLASFPGCDTVYGQLDISVVKLPNPNGHYASIELVLGRLSDDLAAAPTNFDDPDKKYLVLYDGKLSQPGGGYSVCGLSPTTVLGGGANAYAAVFLESPCGDGLGGATNTAGVIAHELIHNLGALQRSGPPNACPGDRGHPCDSDTDVLSPASEYGAILTTLQLDIGRNDYYGHSGSWWDIQDSLFLERIGQTFGTVSGPTALTASTSGARVVLEWPAATSPNGSISAYRVARDGVLLGTVTGTSTGASDQVEAGTTHTWTVQARDALGFLGPVQTVTYTHGAASSGKPAATTAATTAAATTAVRDTTAPPAPKQLRATRTAAGGITLRWQAATDRSGIKGYRLTRNGVAYGGIITGTSLTVPKAKAKGGWAVSAIDKAGNTSRPSATLGVS